MLDGEDHGDVAAQVHNEVPFTLGEPAAFEQWQHFAASLVDVDVAGAVCDACIGQRADRLLLAEFAERPFCPARVWG